ncbi:sulfotransferase family protein [Enemella sp. A6]|uniref:sulfotransferase family protein n=1 Tax=Enemella sp. A6 TaxID=3440152 RepID=UPI003EBC8AA6
MSAPDLEFHNLGHRELTPNQQMATDYANANPVPFNVDAIKEAARDATGLDDFGPDEDALTERMQVWVDVGNEPIRTNMARMAMFGLMTKYLSNRMRVYDFAARHPQVREIEITKPVMVIGLPRSGTSHLVNLIAADSRFRAAPIWELDSPVPPPGGGPGPDGIDPRYKAQERTWDMMTAGNPYMHAWHPMQPWRIEEDIEILAQDFSGYYPEQLYQHAEQWRDYYLAHDQTPHYEYLKLVMQIMTHFRPKDQWVTKYPAHIENIPALLNVFPDAILIETHRDPVASVQSMATMHTYVAQQWQTEVDPQRHMDYWTELCARLKHAGMRDRHLVEPEQIVDVPFAPFMSDNWTAIHTIYDKLGLELTDQARQEIDTFIAEHQLGEKVSRIRYDVRRDFHTTPEDIREPFAEYVAKFDIPAEVT